MILFLVSHIKYVKNLSVLDFAPGSKPIRLAIFSQSAIDVLNEIKTTF